MSAGGGDQYGSYNTPAPEDGIIKVIVDGEEKCARDVNKNAPIIFMSNDSEAIKDWVLQVFRGAGGQSGHRQFYHREQRWYHALTWVSATATRNWWIIQNT